MLIITLNIGPAMVSAEWEPCRASADEFFVKGLAKSTLKSYQSGIRRDKSFCARLSRQTLPAKEETLLAFVAALVKEGVSYTSLKVYLAAIRHYQIQNGLGDPGISQMAHLEYIMRGIRRDGSLKPNPRKERQPITPTLLSKLCSMGETNRFEECQMLWAASCLAFFAFLRVGEFTASGVSRFDDKVHLSISDISVDHLDAPSMVLINLKQSKTDQLRKGVTVVLGKTNKSPLCPVSELFGSEGDGSRSLI